jgi:hypothetical protein
VSNKKEILKGGLSDNKDLIQLAKKHGGKNIHQITKILGELQDELEKGIKVEMEHTDNEKMATEIAMDHLWEDPNYYTKLKKVEMDEKWSEKYKKSIDCSNPKGFSQKAHCQGRKKKDTNEMTGASSAGGYSASMFGTVKRPITKIHNLNEDQEIDEATVADSSGSYDVPFGNGGKNPLKIGGEKSIKKSRAVKDKNFPKWGGPDGVFIKIKEKCKKYPYCNQGDINAIEMLEIDGLVESVKNVSKKTGIPYSYLEMEILNEIKKIFIK